MKYKNTVYHSGIQPVTKKWVRFVIFYFSRYRFCSDSCMRLKLKVFEESIGAAGSAKPVGDELFFADRHIYIPGIIIH